MKSRFFLEQLARLESVAGNHSLFEAIKDLYDATHDDNKSSDNTDEMVKELAELTMNEDVKPTVTRHDDEENKYITVSFDGEEYNVYPDEETATKAAVESCEQVLDDVGIDGINFDELGGIDKFVNEGWFYDAYKWRFDSYWEDFSDEEKAKYNDDSEKYVNSKLDEIDDFVQEYKSEFGSDALNTVVKEMGLVNTFQLAKKIIEVDGRGNELGRYNGEEIELSDGSLAYRVD